jgi:hypothetical protein
MRDLFGIELLWDDLDFTLDYFGMTELGFTLEVFIHIGLLWIPWISGRGRSPTVPASFPRP